MKIKNLHQPYIFEHNEKINFIVSDYVDRRLTFEFGNDEVFEDYWKLCHLDSNYNKTTIDTPSNILYNNENYFVIAECNGFIHEDKISYVVGVHTKKNQEPLSYLLVQGDFDIQKNKVKNLFIKDVGRTGFIKEKKYTLDIKTNKIIADHSEVIFDCSDYLEDIVRLIPVYNKNLMIFTGTKNEDFRSFVLDLSNKNVKSLESKETDKIYKSSIFENGEKKLFAYTDKIFYGESQIDYVLNIDEDYILKDL